MLGWFVVENEWGLAIGWSSSIDHLMGILVVVVLGDCS